MSAIRGKYVDGTVVLDSPADWPNGIDVVVEPLPVGEAIGMRDEDWPTTSEGIAALLKRWDEIEPLEMTPEEEAEWQTGLRWFADYTIAKMDQRIENLFP